MQGFFRYWSPDIKVVLRELSHAESEKESLLKSTLQRLIGRFCEHHAKWKQLVSTTAGTYCGPFESFCHGCAIIQLLLTPTIKFTSRNFYYNDFPAAHGGNLVYLKPSFFSTIR